MNTHRFTQTGTERTCSCGETILSESVTRIRHVIRCFLAGHTYVFVGPRNRHQEYMCTRCGHPLLFRMHRNPFHSKSSFRKKVRYLCNLFGHKVHLVTKRESFHEYACFCGHSFFKEATEIGCITHPLICLFTGHFVDKVCERNDLTEFVCRNCGHTFLIPCENGQ